MRRIQGLMLFLLSGIVGLAEVARIAVDVPEKEAWAGEALSFYVEIRTLGSFGGATYFTLPELKNSVIVQTGNASVSSKRLEGDTWFVQRHAFTLFSQLDGTLTIPSFEVRYGARDGFTGPVEDYVEQTPTFEVKIKRPPNTEHLGFLVTTQSLEIDEQWTPAPEGMFEVGQVFKRTIVQRANRVSGMALLPAPFESSENVSVYLGAVSVDDQTQRGNFVGSREDQLTYLIRKPGEILLPEIEYNWWNSAEDRLETTLLPGAHIQVTAPAPPPKDNFNSWVVWVFVVVALVLLAWFRRARLFCLLSHVWMRIDPPARRASRYLLRACRRNDAEAAELAWYEFRRFHPNAAESPEVQDALRELLIGRYGVHGTEGSWLGGRLSDAIQSLSKSKSLQATNPSLPEINKSHADF